MTWDVPGWAFVVVLTGTVGLAVGAVVISDALGVPSRVAELIAWCGGGTFLAAGGRRFARKVGRRPK